jgi:plasmid replication initiation protein
MKKELVVKDNALINASYNLDLVEQRLILLAIVEARETGKGINANDALSVHAESYINTFNVHRNTAYQALKDACRNLFERRFSYQEVNKKGNIENVVSRWVSEIRYIENESTVKLIFSPAVVPLVTELEKHFTSYTVEQISNLTSGYAVRLYEILIAWRSTGKVTMIELEDLRNRLGLGINEYSRIEAFKRRVLDLAINQINEHTDITASYEQHKKGRVIIGFSFQFKQKPQEKQQEQQRDLKTIDWVNGVSDSEIKGMSPSQAFLYASELYQIPAIVGNWDGDYKDAKNKLVQQLQQPEYVRKYMKYLLDCKSPFDPKTVGFKN